jgi:hypothetical protein
MTTQERGEGRSSKKGLEARLQAEDDDEPGSVPKQLYQRTAETQPSINQMDEASPANTPHALSPGDDGEVFISDDVAEGVWGYLLPLSSQNCTAGTPIALKNGNTSLIAQPKDSKETGKIHHADRNLVASAGRYLIGRYPECGE